MSRVMRKLAFCICENKDAVQLGCNPYYNPPTSYIRNFKPLIIFSGCTAQFVSDLVGNPEDGFSHDTANIVLLYMDLYAGIYIRQCLFLLKLHWFTVVRHCEVFSNFY